MCEEAYVNKIMFIYESEKNLKSWPTVSKLEWLSISDCIFTLLLHTVVISCKKYKPRKF